MRKKFPDSNVTVVMVRVFVSRSMYCKDGSSWAIYGGMFVSRTKVSF